MYRFTFDHAVSDGERGYGAVRVEHGDKVWHIGRGFARTVLVERFPDVGLTYDEARELVIWLSAMPTGAREFVHEVDLSLCSLADDECFGRIVGGRCFRHADET